MFYTQQSIFSSPRFIPGPYFIPSPQSVVRSPQSVFYTDRSFKSLLKRHCKTLCFARLNSTRSPQSYPCPKGLFLTQFLLLLLHFCVFLSQLSELVWKLAEEISLQSASKRFPSFGAPANGNESNAKISRFRPNRNITGAIYYWSLILRIFSVVSNSTKCDAHEFLKVLLLSSPLLISPHPVRKSKFGACAVTGYCYLKEQNGWGPSIKPSIYERSPRVWSENWQSYRGIQEKEKSSPFLKKLIAPPITTKSVHSIYLPYGNFRMTTKTTYYFYSLALTLCNLLYSYTKSACCIVRYVFSAVQIMLLPSQKPSSSYSLLKFLYVTSQLRHFLEVHPLLRKNLDQPLQKAVECHIGSPFIRIFAILIKVNWQLSS